MNQTDLLEKLRSHSRDYTPEELDELIDFFDRDATSENRFISDFMDLHDYIEIEGATKDQHRVHMIRQKYIFALHQKGITRHEHFPMFYAHDSEYYLGVNSYSECLRSVFKVLEDESTTPYVLASASTIMLTILMECGLYEYCYQYFEPLKEPLAKHKFPKHTEFFLQMAYMTFSGLAGDEKTADRYYEMLKEYNETDIPETCFAYLELYYLAVRSVSTNKRFSNDEYLTRVKEVVDAIVANSAFKDTYAACFIPICRYLSKFAKIEEIAELIYKLADFTYAISDKLNLLNFLFEELNASRTKFKDIYDDYLESLQSYYRIDQKNRTAVIVNGINEHALEKEYKLSSITDKLTGIGNRQAYSEKVASLTEGLGLLSPDLCVIMMDLNSLKKENDEYGHIAGDALICAASRFITDSFEGLGEAFRMGGDEFVTIVIADEETVKERLEILLKKCENWSTSTMNKYGTELSISVGYAFNYEIDAKTIIKNDRISEAYKLADRRMYENKREMKMS